MSTTTPCSPVWLETWYDPVCVRLSTCIKAYCLVRQVALAAAPRGTHLRRSWRAGRVLAKSCSGPSICIRPCFRAAVKALHCASTIMYLEIRNLVAVHKVRDCVLARGGCNLQAVRTSEGGAPRVCQWLCFVIAHVSRVRNQQSSIRAPHVVPVGLRRTVHAAAANAGAAAAVPFGPSSH